MNPPYYESISVTWANVSWVYPTSIYPFEDNNRTTRKICEKCSELKIKTPE